MPPLSPELFWLTLTALMTAVIWIPYILNRIAEMGLWPALRNPEPDTHAKAAWANRMQAGHSNAVENLVVFAPLAVAVHVAGAGTATTAFAAATYFFARLAHIIVYTLGIPGLRTLAFFIGFLAQVAFAFTLIGWL